MERDRDFYILIKNKGKSGGETLIIFSTANWKGESHVETKAKPRK